MVSGSAFRKAFSFCLLEDSFKIYQILRYYLFQGPWFLFWCEQLRGSDLGSYPGIGRSGKLLCPWPGKDSSYDKSGGSVSSEAFYFAQYFEGKQCSQQFFFDITDKYFIISYGFCQIWSKLGNKFPLTYCYIFFLFEPNPLGVQRFFHLPLFQINLGAQDLSDLSGSLLDSFINGNSPFVPVYLQVIKAQLEESQDYLLISQFSNMPLYGEGYSIDFYRKLCYLSDSSFPVKYPIYIVDRQWFFQCEGRNFVYPAEALIDECSSFSRV